MPHVKRNYVVFPIQAHGLEMLEVLTDAAKTLWACGKVAALYKVGWGHRLN